MTTKRRHASQVARFGAVGAVASGVHLSIAHLCLWLDLVPLLFANLVGFTFGFAFGLAGHHWYTFRRNTGLQQSLWRYGIIAIFGLFVNTTVLAGLDASGWLSREAAITISILIVPALSYLASRFWAFSGS